jgi:signal peptidase II
MKRKYAFFALAGAATIFFDLGTKAWVEATFRLYESLTVVEGFFNIAYVRNPGVAFGMMADAPALRIPLLIAVTAAVMAVLVLMLRRMEPEERANPVWLGLIFGGAAGNMVDRLRYGEVVDFLDLFWGTYHWPTFNVADIAICVGIGAMLASDLLRHRSRGREAL